MNTIIALMITINVAMAIDSNEHPTYTVDMAELIFEYYHKYKHIKRLSMFLCDDKTAQFGPSLGVSAAMSPGTMESTMTAEQLVKHLMATGKFAIKGVRNIDETGRGPAEGGNVPMLETIDLIGMLLCGDFKQGVVLDLRCRRSDFILQQVSQLKLASCVVLEFVYIGSEF